VIGLSGLGLAVESVARLDPPTVLATLTATGDPGVGPTDGAILPVAGIAADPALPPPMPSPLVLYPASVSVGTTSPDPSSAGTYSGVPVAITTALPDDRARIAVATALAQRGLPYVWGGDGPANGDAGFDCSGLTTFSYAAAGVGLPRTAHTQYYAGPRVPGGEPLQPGDLVFYGTPAFVHHVGMYLGEGRMINAPRFGRPVQTAWYRWAGDDYLGASRPAAIGQAGTLPLPQAPAPTPRPVEPDEFEAPPAPLPAEPLPAPTDPQPPESESAAAALDGAAAVPVLPTATVPPAAALAEPTSAAAPMQPSPVATAPATPTAAEPSAAAVPAITTPTSTPPAPTSTPTPSATTPSVSPAATTSTTTAPPATTPSASAPAVSTPPTTTTSTPVAANGAANPRITSLTVGGTTIRLRTVGAAPDAVPAAAGVWTSRGRTAVRLASTAELDGVTPGAALTLTRADGSTSRHAVAERTVGNLGEVARLIAAQPAGTVVLIAPAPEGSWTIVRA
jgi:cell wall-associated NlpC family hydrolase